MYDTDDVSNGGDAGNGEPAGVGGAAGMKAITGVPAPAGAEGSPPQRAELGAKSFEKGKDGKGCAVQVGAATSVKSDPGNHHFFINLPGGITLEVKANAQTGTIEITGPFPWVTVSGDWNPVTGEFSAAGVGTVAGFPLILVIFEGVFNGLFLDGDYEMGAGGGLPGGLSIIYSVFGSVL